MNMYICILYFPFQTSYTSSWRILKYPYTGFVTATRPNTAFHSFLQSFTAFHSFTAFYSFLQLFYSFSTAFYSFSTAFYSIILNSTGFYRILEQIKPSKLISHNIVDGKSQESSPQHTCSVMTSFPCSFKPETRKKYFHQPCLGLKQHSRLVHDSRSRRRNL